MKKYGLFTTITTLTTHLKVKIQRRIASKKRMAEFRGLFEILKQDGHGKVYDNTTWRNSLNICGNGNELYIKFQHQTIIIRRIILNHSRHKYGTRIFEWLRHYAKEKGYKEIIVENALSEAIVKFCINHGFSVVPDYNMDEEEYISGNYSLKL